MLRGLVSALRTLTVLSVPGRDAERMSSSLPWFPLAGLLMGLVLYGLAELCVRITAWPAGTAVVLVAAGIILTRGLHMDGLADWADGFGGGSDRDRILRIMKDSHIGSFGVSAVAVGIVAKYACLGRLLETGHLTPIILAYIVSRTAQVDLMTAQPYARPEGGTAAAFVATAAFYHLLAAAGGALVLIFALDGLQWFGPAMLVTGLIISRFFGFWSRRRIGGITGDVVGACSELVETAVLFAGVVAGQFTGACGLFTDCCL